MDPVNSDPDSDPQHWYFVSVVFYRFSPQPTWQSTTLRIPIQRILYTHRGINIPRSCSFWVENSPIIRTRKPESMQQYSVKLAKCREMAVRSQTLPRWLGGRSGKDDRKQNTLASLSLVLFGLTLLDYSAGI